MLHKHQHANIQCKLQIAMQVYADASLTCPAIHDSQEHGSGQATVILQTSVLGCLNIQGCVQL